MNPATIPSFRRLRVFETVGRLESVSRASDEVHLSQPAVTQAIAKLETEFGVSLFERRNTGSYLTSHGEILRRRTERLFEQIEGVLRQAGVGTTEGEIAFASSRITRTQVRGLLAIAETGSFAQAARMIGISQASLHRAARDLERSLRLTLYHQTANGNIITDTGLLLARSFALAIREIESAMDEVQAAKDMIHSRIAVGALPLAGTFLLSSVLNEFTGLFPNTPVQVTNGDYETLLNALRAGTIDFLIGITRPSEAAKDIVAEGLYRDPYQVVVRRDHPLTRLAEITSADLAAYEWIVPSRSPTRGVVFDHLFEGVVTKPPRANIETYSFSTIRAILSDSDRLALLSRCEIEFEERMGILTVLPLAPLYPVPEIGLITRADWLPTEVQVRFHDLLRERSRRLSPQFDCAS